MKSFCRSRVARTVERVSSESLVACRDVTRTRERLVGIARIVDAAVPWLDDDQLALVCRMNLWIFAIDDRFDDRCDGADVSALEGLVGACCAAAVSGARPSVADAVADEVAALRRAVAQLPGFAQLGGRWIAAVCAVAEGMMQEWRWARAHRERGGDALPSFEDYLAVGEASIGLGPHIWLTAMLAADAAPSSARLMRMVTTASRCVRLANDLRSASREEKEGGINGVVVLAHETQSRRSFDVRRALAARVTAELDALDDLGRAPFTASGRAEASIGAIARGLCALYRERDFPGAGSSPASLEGYAGPSCLEGHE